MSDPQRGDVWLVGLSPVVGHEQAGRRPALVVSDDVFNQGPADLVVVVPMTSRQKGVPLHVQIDPPEGGLRVRSFAMCENVRAISKQRLIDKWGSVRVSTMLAVEDRLRVVLRL